eukprot:jgi/Bigna1/86695/estExt_fgenesh1_pg.C_120275
MLRVFSSESQEPVFLENEALEEDSIDDFLGNEGALMNSQDSEDSVETAYDSQESEDSVNILAGMNSQESEESVETVEGKETSSDTSLRSEFSVDSALVHSLESEDVYSLGLFGTGNENRVMKDDIRKGVLVVDKESFKEVKRRKVEDRGAYLDLQLPPSPPLSLTSEVTIVEGTKKVPEFPCFSPEVLADLKHSSGFGNVGERAKKRSRVGMACDRCHIRKTKCDGRIPCNNCKKSSKVCLYHEAKARRDENLARPPSERKRLADSVNKYRGESCIRTPGCRRPLRHPGHCRTGPGRNRKRKER